MTDSGKTPRPTARTLAVIDGGLNVKAGMHPSPSTGKPKLLEQVRQAIRKRHYSDRTEKVYVHWIKRFIFFHSKRHPMEMGEAEIGQFLSSLATEGRVSASTQNQALNALLFLDKEVLNKTIGLVEGVVRAKRPQRLPIVLTKDEVRHVIDHMNGVPRLMAILLYGGGLRLMECCRLRVKDIDFSRNEIVIRAGKGDKDRHTMLPAAIKGPLFKQIEVNRSQHQEDLRKGFGRVALPNALERKYPNAGRDWAWQWVFPAPQQYTDRITGAHAARRRRQLVRRPRCHRTTPVGATACPFMPHEYAILRNSPEQAWYVVEAMTRLSPNAYRAFFRGYQSANRYWEAPDGQRYWRSRFELDRWSAADTEGLRRRDEGAHAIKDWRGPRWAPNGSSYYVEGSPGRWWQSAKFFAEGSRHVVRASGGQETCPSHDDRSACNLHQPEAISSRPCIAGPGTRRSDRSALVPVGRRSRPPSLLRSSPVSCGDSQASMDAKVARFVLHSRTASFERGLWGAAAREGVLDESSPQNSSLDPTARLRLAAGQRPISLARKGLDEYKTDHRGRLRRHDCEYPC